MWRPCPRKRGKMLPEDSCVRDCGSVYISASTCLQFLVQADGGWISWGSPTHALYPFRLKLNSKRNQLVRELEEATRQVAALHSQLKR